MPKAKKNFDEIIRRYQEEVRVWTRSWLENNLHKPLPRWDENGNPVSSQEEQFDLWSPKESMIEFTQEIAHDYIIPYIQEDLESKGAGEQWEDLMLPSEDSASDYIFPILMKTFRDEAYEYLGKLQVALREIDRDLLGYPNAGFAANRILSAIVDEIEDELADDRALKSAPRRKAGSTKSRAAKPGK